MVGGTLTCSTSAALPCTRRSCRFPSSPWPWPGPAAIQPAAATASTAKVSPRRGRRSRLLARLHASRRAGPHPSPINRPLAASSKGWRRTTLRPSLPALLLAPLEELLEQALLLVGIVRRRAHS